MTQHQNSLGAWHEEVKPTLRKRQLQVLKIYQKVGEGTATDIMAITRRPRNVIHPRIGELKELGYLEEVRNKVIGRRNHAVLRVTSLGWEVDTTQVEDITPEEKYYGKEDYRHFCRAFYNHITIEGTSTETEEVKKQLSSFLGSIK